MRRKPALHVEHLFSPNSGAVRRAIAALLRMSDEARAHTAPEESDAHRTL